MEPSDEPQHRPSDASPRRLTRTADRWTVATYPLMIVCCGIGALCGVTFILLWSSAYMGWIEEVDFIEQLGFGWAVGGGFGMILGAFGGMISFREQPDAAAERIDAARS